MVPEKYAELGFEITKFRGTVKSPEIWRKTGLCLQLEQ